jgi:hypothetical protein
MINMGKLKNSEENLLQFNFVHLESHLKIPGLNPRLRGEKPTDLWHGLYTGQFKDKVTHMFTMK